jgi:L-Ala-D/L-Glu epimerase
MVPDSRAVGFARAGAEVREIPATGTWELRGRVLRPHQRGGSLALPGDDAPGAVHLGAFVAGELLAIASLLPELPPPLSAEPWRHSEREPAAATLPGDWRLRGMAARAEARRRGLGRALVHAAIDRAVAAGGTALWCHARVGAQPFYTALGLRTVGGPFDLPQIGPHVFMWTPI